MNFKYLIEALLINFLSRGSHVPHRYILFLYAMLYAYYDYFYELAEDFLIMRVEYDILLSLVGYPDHYINHRYFSMQF